MPPKYYIFTEKEEKENTFNVDQSFSSVHDVASSVSFPSFFLFLKSPLSWILFFFNQVVFYRAVVGSLSGFPLSPSSPDVGGLISGIMWVALVEPLSNQGIMKVKRPDEMSKAPAK